MFTTKSGSGGDGHGGTTIIARGVKVEGDFSSQSDVLIEGDVHGTFSTTGVLTVGQEARIKADVSAGEAFVCGVIEGNVIVAKRLEVKASAKIIGDVSADTIVIESGAVINGRMVVGIKSAVIEKTLNNKRERPAGATGLLMAER